MGEGTKATGRERSDRGRGPARFRANGLHQLPCRQWHGGKWTIRTGPHAFDGSRHSWLGRAHEFSRRAARMDQVPRAVQTGSADACDESEQRRFGQNGGLSHVTQMNGTLRTGDIGSTLPLVSIAETEKSVLDSVH